MASHAEQLIERADRQAEGVLGAVRIVCAVVLGATAFLLSVGPPPPGVDAVVGATELPRPPTFFFALVLIACFFVTGLLSTLAVVTQRYSPWMAWVFGAGDVIIVALYLFITNEMTGASSFAALASPASYLAMLIFVLQTLRFRVKLQAILSIAMFCCLVALVFHHPEERFEGATDRFLALNFNDVPSIVRLVLALLIAAIAGVAVYRAQRLLFRVAQEIEIRSNQTRFLPGELAERLTDADLADMRQGRRVDVAIMFIDVRGFTSMSERLRPEEIAVFLRELRRRIHDAVVANGGIIDKFIGDGALVVFGLNAPLEEACRQSLLAADDMQAAIVAWNKSRPGEQPVRLVISIHAGAVIAGALGDASRLEFSVVGSPVNETSRIEAVGKERDLPLIVSGPVLEAAGVEPNGWRDLQNVMLRGRSEPLHLFGRETESVGYRQGLSGEKTRFRRDLALKSKPALAPPRASPSLTQDQ